MTNSIAYCTMLTVGVSAYFGMPWTILLIGACILTMITVLEQRRYRVQLQAIGMADLLYTTGLAAAGSGLLACLASYSVGFVVRSVVAG